MSSVLSESESDEEVELDDQEIASNGPPVDYGLNEDTLD